jgi:hypothetical protein
VRMDCIFCTYMYTCIYTYIHRENNNFGLRDEQVTVMKQNKVPALMDSDARFAVKEGMIETKPHGHGDVHTLMHQTGLAKVLLCMCVYVCVCLYVGRYEDKIFYVYACVYVVCMRFAVKKGMIETNPHGHGDVHTLMPRLRCASFIFLYACVYICVYTCIYIYIYIYIYIHTHAYIYTYKHTEKWANSGVRWVIFFQDTIYSYRHTHIHMHTYIHTYIHNIHTEMGQLGCPLGDLFPGH